MTIEQPQQVKKDSLWWEFLRQTVMGGANSADVNFNNRWLCLLFCADEDFDPLVLACNNNNVPYSGQYGQYGMPTRSGKTYSTQQDSAARE